ncbi:MAG: cytidine deaminase [Acidobacteriota bacterium]
MTAQELIRLAREARQRAHAPYSGFQVGAAVETAGGRFFSGCNVENSSYGLTLCAERVAIFKAVSEGCTDLIGLCVVADTAHLTPPCGACRQIIWEFCGDIPVLLTNLSGDRKLVRSSELLPFPFDDRQLD